MTTRVKPYAWRNGDKETPGAQIRHSGRAQVFIPLEELVRVSNELIDIFEQHERKAH